MVADRKANCGPGLQWDVPDRSGLSQTAMEFAVRSSLACVVSDRTGLRLHCSITPERLGSVMTSLT